MAGIHEPGAGLFTGSGITGSGSAFDWPSESRFWQGKFPDLSYINADRTYDFYEPAFRYGAESASGHERSWDEMEPHLREGWEGYPHRQPDSGNWDEVRPAVHDAWHQYRERNPIPRRAADRARQPHDPPSQKP